VHSNVGLDWSVEFDLSNAIYGNAFVFDSPTPANNRRLLLMETIMGEFECCKILESQNLTRAVRRIDRRTVLVSLYFGPV